MRGKCKNCRKNFNRGHWFHKIFLFDNPAVTVNLTCCRLQYHFEFVYLFNFMFNFIFSLSERKLRQEQKEHLLVSIQPF